MPPGHRPAARARPADPAPGGQAGGEPLTVALLLWAALALDDGAAFAERHPLSRIEELARRHGFDPPADYDLSVERFRIELPPADSGTAPPGLFVWISPTADLRELPPWVPETLGRQRLIFVAAYRSGNDRPKLHRWGLALDAVHNLRARHAVDERRIYVAGFSGGGRTACQLAVTFPDVFRGALCVCGVNYYRKLRDPSRPGYSWNYFDPPPRRLLARARRNLRLVLLTGENDFNRLQTRVYYERGYKRDGFRHVTLLEVPGMAHQVPGDPAWLDRAIEALDAPLGEGPGR